MENRDKRIYKVTLTGGIVNMLLLVFKFVAGVLGNSAAMIADAVHSLSDFLTDIVVIAFVKLSSKPADQDHDYGHGKYETVASSIIGMALVVVAVLLGWGGVEKIIQVAKGEQLEQPGVIALVAAVLSVALKEWVFRITKKVALDVNSQALEANAWHHRSDAMSSVGTSIGIGGAVLLGKSWAVLDPIASVVVSIMILIAAFRLLRQASGELLEESTAFSALAGFSAFTGFSGCSASALGFLPRTGGAALTGAGTPSQGWPETTGIWRRFSFSIPARYSFSSGAQKLTAVPSAPARAVRPMRWT